MSGDQGYPGATGMPGGQGYPAGPGLHGDQGYGGYQGPGQQAFSGPQGYPQQAYPGYPVYPVRPPDHPSATTIMVLGIVSLVGAFTCALPLLLGPFAWNMGAKARREIAEANGALGGYGQVQAGYICGIISTVLLGLTIVGFVIFFIVLMIGGLASTAAY